MTTLMDNMQPFDTEFFHFGIHCLSAYSIFKELQRHRTKLNAKDERF